MIHTCGHQASSGGRRAELLAVDDTSRVAVVAEIGPSHASAAVANLRGTLLATHTVRLTPRHLPVEVLPRMVSTAKDLLAGTGRAGDLAAVGLSVPGQVDHAAGTSIMPPTLPAWRNWPLRALFGTELGVEVLLENDANALAYGEYLVAGRREATVLGVKVGTGVGAGVVIGGRPHRGATGCAGEIGHIRIDGREQRCGCGQSGCVTALASGQALLRALRRHGARSLPDVVRQIEVGDPRAVALAADAGRLLGTVLATVVTILNPHLVRIGGEVGCLQPFLAGLTETLGRQAHQVAARKLDIGPAALGENAPLVGMAGLVADAVFAPAAVDRLARPGTIPDASADTTGQ
jgi:predicted NBD/HSP70 family sugar kinase